MKRLFLTIILSALVLGVWASNTITYTATAKLTETTDDDMIPRGLNTEAFYNGRTLLTMTSHTFSDSTGLITFDGEITTIGAKAFMGSSQLTAIDIPNSVTTIGGSAFSGCRALTSVTIHEGVTTIGSLVFNACSELTALDLPNSLTTIGDFAFMGCSGLTSVTIGNGVTTIGDAAFMGCANISNIYSYASIPPDCSSGDDTFRAMGQSTTIVHVPVGAVDLYKEAIGWRYFYNIIDVASDLESTDAAASGAATKFYHDGHIYLLLPDGTTYDATGRRVN